MKTFDGSVRNWMVMYDWNKKDNWHRPFDNITPIKKIADSDQWLPGMQDTQFGTMLFLIVIE